MERNSLLLSHLSYGLIEGLNYGARSCQGMRSYKADVYFRTRGHRHRQGSSGNLPVIYRRDARARASVHKARAIMLLCVVDAKLSRKLAALAVAIQQRGLGCCGIVFTHRTTLLMSAEVANAVVLLLPQQGDLRLGCMETRDKHRRTVHSSPPYPGRASSL